MATEITTGKPRSQLAIGPHDSIMGAARPTNDKVCHQPIGISYNLQHDTCNIQSTVSKH